MRASSITLSHSPAWRAPTWLLHQRRQQASVVFGPAIGLECGPEQRQGAVAFV